MTTSEVRQHIAANVRAELARQQVSAASLPKALGGSQSGWQRRLSGQVPISGEELAALAKLLDVPLGSFFFGVDKQVSG